MVKNLLANTGTMGSVHGSGRSLGEGNGHEVAKEVRHDSATKQQQQQLCISIRLYTVVRTSVKGYE